MAAHSQTLLLAADDFAAAAPAIASARYFFVRLISRIDAIAGAGAVLFRSRVPHREKITAFMSPVPGAIRTCCLSGNPLVATGLIRRKGLQPW